MEHWQVMMATAIGGVTIGLPFVLVKSIRVPIKKWIMGAGLALVGSLFFSFIVASGGECSFLETFLMLKSGCNNLPFANTRTVPILNALAFICIFLLVVSVFRAVVTAMLTRK